MDKLSKEATKQLREVGEYMLAHPEQVYMPAYWRVNPECGCIIGHWAMMNGMPQPIRGEYGFRLSVDALGIRNSRMQEDWHEITLRIGKYGSNWRTPEYAQRVVDALNAFLDEWGFDA